MTKLVLWDWNGTLLDDLDVCVLTLNRLLARHGYPQQYDKAGYQKIFDFPIVDYYIRAGFDFSKHSFEMLAESFMRDYIPTAQSCGIVPGTKEVVDTIHERGVPQVILSASAITTLEKQVAERGLDSSFDRLLGLGDIYAKSKVELGIRFMEESGINPADAVMVGDTLHDYKVAQAMGCRCVLMSLGHHSREKLLTAGVPVIDSPSQLLNYL